MVGNQSILGCRFNVRFATAIGLSLVMAITSALSSAAAPMQILRGHVPAAVAKLHPMGRLPSTNQLTISIGLPLRNPEALTNLLAELYDPSSTNYRKFLTPDEFTERFGPSEGDYQAVKNFALANGLIITHEHGNRMLLTVKAAVADIEKALRVHMLTYAHPKENRTFFAPDSEPSLPAELSLLHVSGLDSYVVPHPMSLKKPLFGAAGFAKSYSGSAPEGTFMGNDFRAAYVPGSSLTGAGQSVALVEFDGYYAADIASYESRASIAPVTLTNVLLEGFNGTPVDPDANVEVSLDIEMLVSMAPGLSRIIVYEEPNNDNVPDDLLSQMATDNLAAQISSSWSYGIDSTTEQIFLQYASQGISFFNASGDSGAYTSADGGPPSPCDDPNITSVGGTTLTTTGPGGTWEAETVWNWFTTGEGDGAGSGGVSTVYSIPSWQLGVSMTACQGSTSMRNLPDVALTADNIFVEANNGQAMPGIGGTSAATPLWAGFMALVNQQAAAAGKSRIGFVNPAIYAIGKSAQYNSAFHDITTGNNTNYDSPNLYYAVTGYDLCTGWGTPAGTNLINSLAPVASGPVISLNSIVLAAESCLPTNGVIDSGETVTVNLALRNIGTAATGNLIATLQSGGGVIAPGASQSYGALAINGSAVTMPFTFTAGASCGSNVTATFQLEDGSTNLGSVSASTLVGKFVNNSNITQNFDNGAFPTGWSTTAVGGESGWSITGSSFSSYPYSIFTPDNGVSGLSELITAQIPIASANAQLTFQSACMTFNLHAGGVLEIQVGTNVYQDILAAGGSFAAGAYNSAISVTNTANPLAGRAVWSGSTGGWNNTVVNLPAAAAGQNVRLKWRLGSDTYYNYYGWFLDTIVLTESYYSCCGDTADLGVTQSASATNIVAGHSLNYTVTVTNSGPQIATGVSLTNTLPSGVTFGSASSGGAYANGKVVWNIGSLAAHATNQYIVTVTPTTGGSITNIATISAVTPDPNSANQTASAVISVSVSPSIINQPSNQVALLGSNTTFQVAATGMPAPAYQWYFNGSNLAGATATSLTLTNIQMTRQGAYYAIATNMAGTATSAVANLTVAAKPAISQQPSNLTVLAGKPVSFQVTANGAPTPAYQWCFNGSNLAGATMSTLSFSSAQPAQAGTYCVLLTNVAGSTISTNAVLIVNVPLPLLSLSLSGSNITVSLNSLVGVNYTLQSKDTLATTNWTAATSPQPGTGGTINLNDTNPGPNARFYRVLCSW